MIVTINEFDTCAQDLQYFALEYAKRYESEWFLADTVSMDSVRILMKAGQNYVQLTWNVIGDDGEYKIRARTMCKISNGYSQEVVGIIDRQSPTIVGVPEPVAGVLTPHNQISMTVNEDIAADRLSPYNGQLYFALSGEAVATEISCFENTFYLTPASSVANIEIENHRLKAEVRRIPDMAGNTMIPDTIAWEFVVDRNPVHWNSEDLEVIVYVGEETMVPISLNNSGAAASNFKFGNLRGLPDFLSILPMYGDINPGGTLPVFLFFDPYMNNGTYYETIYAETPAGYEPLHLTVYAICPPPVWDVSPAMYEYSMSVTAKLSVQGEQCIDEFDRVGAFVGDECRGWAPLKHVVTENDTGLVVYDDYITYLTVYSDVINGETVDFRIWDNSDCEELWEIQSGISFEANSFAGTPASPLVLNAPGAIAQNLAFNEGWTWFSLNLDNTDMSFANVFSKHSAIAGDRIISLPDYAEYSETGVWAGPLSTATMDNLSMIQAHSSASDKFAFIGYRFDTAAKLLYPASGWNWISYTPRINIPVIDALKSLTPTTNDLIKSQTGFAQYDANYGWMGSLEWMEPGKGYMLQLANKDTLIYPGAEYDGRKGDLLAKNSSSQSEDSLSTSPWTVDEYKYRGNMSLVAEIECDTVNVYDPSDVIVVFSGDEVRGVARPQLVEAMGTYRVYLTIYGRSNDDLNLKIWDASTDITYSANEHFTYAENEVIGSAVKPVFLTKAALQIGDRGFVPEDYSLSQNYPNPFNPVTRMGFGLPENASTIIKVYNIRGQEVKTLIDKKMDKGYYFMYWNGTDDFGLQAASGVYLIVMQSKGTKNFRKVQKVTLLR